MWIDLYSSCSTGADFAPRGHLTNFGHIWDCQPGGSAGKESTCSVGDVGTIPGLGRSPGEGKGYPLQYSGLENPMDYRVHGVTKSRIRLRDFHFTLLDLSSKSPNFSPIIFLSFSFAPNLRRMLSINLPIYNFMTHVLSFCYLIIHDCSQN